MSRQCVCVCPANRLFLFLWSLFYCWTAATRKSRWIILDAVTSRPKRTNIFISCVRAFFIHIYESIFLGSLVRGRILGESSQIVNSVAELSKRYRLSVEWVAGVSEVRISNSNAIHCSKIERCRKKDDEKWVEHMGCVRVCNWFSATNSICLRQQSHKCDILAGYRCEQNNKLHFSLCNSGDHAAKPTDTV